MDCQRKGSLARVAHCRQGVALAGAQSIHRGHVERAYRQQGDCRQQISPHCAPPPPPPPPPTHTHRSRGMVLPRTDVLPTAGPVVWPRRRCWSPLARASTPRHVPNSLTSACAPMHQWEGQLAPPARAHLEARFHQPCCSARRSVHFQGGGAAQVVDQQRHTFACLQNEERGRRGRLEGDRERGGGAFVRANFRQSPNDSL